MGNVDTKKALLVLIIFVFIAIRLAIAFSVEGVSYDSYFAVRQVQSIQQTGLPMFVDPLSYGGKINLFMPVFYYLLTAFSLFMPIIVAIKLVPVLLFAVALLFIYGISLKLTKSETISLMTVFFSGLIPISFLFKGSPLLINNATPTALALPLFLAIIYFFIDIEVKNHPLYVLILTVLMVLTTPLASVLLLTYVVYLVLLRTEKVRPFMVEKEIILFTFFLVVWVDMIIYKKALLFHGAAVIWQNIPSKLLENYFAKISLLDSIYAMGIIPLLLGVYVLYRTLSAKTSKLQLLLSSSIICVFVLLWFRLIPLGEGLLLLGIMLVIISAAALKLLSTYIAITKFEKYKVLLSVGLVVLFVATSVIPSVPVWASLEKATPSSEETAALSWIAQNTPPDAVVLATLQEGSVITAIAQRKNVIDNNFLLVDNIDKRYDDVQAIFTTKLAADALRRLRENSVSYLYISKEYAAQYGTNTIVYGDETSCLHIVYNKTVLIYEHTCTGDVS